MTLIYCYSEGKLWHIKVIVRGKIKQGKHSTPIYKYLPLDATYHKGSG